MVHELLSTDIKYPGWLCFGMGFIYDAKYNSFFVDEDMKIKNKVFTRNTSWNESHISSPGNNVEVQNGLAIRIRFKFIGQKRHSNSTRRIR